MSPWNLTTAGTGQHKGKNNTMERMTQENRQRLETGPQAVWALSRKGSYEYKIQRIVSASR
jgi:hypothetical protein